MSQPSEPLPNDTQWNSAAPRTLPASSYTPGAMALGVMLTFWSFFTHWAMAVTGLLLIAWALRRWMTEICDDWSRADD